MVKKNNLKQIPMLPTRVWDSTSKQLVDKGILSAVTYDGEFAWRGTDPSGRHIQILPTPVDNIPFTDTLTYVNYYRGRSAAGIMLENKEGRIFHVFMSDFHEMMPFIVHGKITDTFIYCKKGKNYGLQLYRQPVSSENS